MITQAQDGVIRFVDLCAGLGGFHHGIAKGGATLDGTAFQCVLASEIDPLLRESYVANFPYLEESYRHSFPPARVASSLRMLTAPEQREALDVYSGKSLRRVHGDLAAFVDLENDTLRNWPGTDEPMFPEHDLLCAGFPCQPFSKSGAQRGFSDLRGTVFHLIAVILKWRRPALVLLENVGNFERHDAGNTWATVKAILGKFGYDIAATCHKATGGPDCQGLLSPHHLGHPHHRERFFIVGQRRGMSLVQPLEGKRVFPVRPKAMPEKLKASQEAKSRMAQIIADGPGHASESELRRSQIMLDHAVCIEHWQRLLDMLAEADNEMGAPHFRSTMPSFPIWGYELDPWQWYPIDHNPADLLRTPDLLERSRRRLLREAASAVASRRRGEDLMNHPPGGSRGFLARIPMSDDDIQSWVRTLPAYAAKRTRWPNWKMGFLRQNRKWAVELWARLDSERLREWLDRLVSDVPAPSNQKLEWNCKGEALSLDNLILQFRPSGLRAKRFGHVPALVAMTTTQIPLVPQKDRRPGSGESRASQSHRHLLASEALQLQGFPATWRYPAPREAAFRAFGNAVHCDVVAVIIERWLGPASQHGGQTDLLSGSPTTDAP